MFAGTGLTTLPNTFTLPAGITTPNLYFCHQMFTLCRNLTTLSNSFNLPQNITGSVGTDFCRGMFDRCSSLSTLPSIFNLPSNITMAESNFCYDMFSGCSSLTTLPSNFTLPANITTINSDFYRNTFKDCSSLGALPSSFNLPTGITTVGGNFCSQMFYGCSHNNFKVNAAFKFPQLSQSEIDKSGVFYQTFYCSTNKTYPPQNVRPQDIIGSNPTPSSNRQTFTAGNATQSAGRWGTTYNSLPAQWK